ncbi:MAG: hypothetical protein DWQ58_19610 [Microcystis aeruginosa TA09]|nr:MAG: hypothetical protein DWQ58_19610 [Microcystis aeruginosa TA09]
MSFVSLWFVPLTAPRLYLRIHFTHQTWESQTFSLIPLTGNDFLAPDTDVGIFFSIFYTITFCNQTISRTLRSINFSISICFSQWMITGRSSALSDSVSLKVKCLSHLSTAYPEYT